MATQMNAPPLAGLTGLARRLVADGALSEADARGAVQEAAGARTPLARHLVQNALVDTQRVMHALSAEFGVPVLDLDAIDLAQVPIKLVS
ncbi:type IV pilus biogenesis protein PilB, partial [mine drainage metagenome]